MNVVEWSWFEDSVTGQTEGSFRSLEGLSCKAWIPAVFVDQEQEPLEAEGFTLFLRMRAETEEGKTADLVFGTTGASVYSMDQLTQRMQETGYISEITPMIINGYSGFIYKTNPEGCTGFGAVLAIDGSTILVVEGNCPADAYDSAYEGLIYNVLFSVQPE